MAHCGIFILTIYYEIVFANITYINLIMLSPVRSIEKTDYTYAQSYSYRTEVTPDRVIMMPNMTRRPIERSHSGEGFSSPELKVGSYRTSLFSSKTVTSQELKSGKINNQCFIGVLFHTEYNLNV